MPAVASGHRVALVTSAAHRHLDDDLDPVAAALEALGVAVTIADWHDATLAWDRFDLAVVRSPWDYTTQLEAFLAWSERVAAVTTLANPRPVLAWNTDKRYLVQLAAHGVPVVPTTVLEPGEARDAASDQAGDATWDRAWASAATGAQAVAGVAAGASAGGVAADAAAVVVKPVVSAGARDTERFDLADAAAAHAHAGALLGAGRAVLVQPYLAGVESQGETALVYLGDRFSHALRKGALLVPGVEMVEGLYRREQMAARDPASAELDVADQVLDALGACLPGVDRRDLLYARVDLVPGPDGAPVLLELEVTEPSLFHAHAPGSAARFAEAIAARLDQT